MRPLTHVHSNSLQSVLHACDAFIHKYTSFVRQMAQIHRDLIDLTDTVRCPQLSRAADSRWETVTPEVYPRVVPFHPRFLLATHRGLGDWQMHSTPAFVKFLLTSDKFRTVSARLANWFSWIGAIYWFICQTCFVVMVLMGMANILKHDILETYHFLTTVILYFGNFLWIVNAINSSYIRV